MQDQDIELISLEDIKNYRDALKLLSKSWLNDLMERMKKEDETVTRDRVYNIIHGVVVHQQHRRLFVKHAAILLAEEKEKQKQAISEIKSDDQQETEPPQVTEDVTLSLENNMNERFERQLNKISNRQ